MGGKGFLGMPPAKGVPRRFLEMPRKVAVAPPVVQTSVQEGAAKTPAPGAVEGAGMDVPVLEIAAAVKTEDVVAT